LLPKNYCIPNIPAALGKVISLIISLYGNGHFCKKKIFPGVHYEASKPFYRSESYIISYISTEIKKYFNIGNIRSMVKMENFNVSPRVNLGNLTLSRVGWQLKGKK
jgi:hypothetical protein